MTSEATRDIRVGLIGHGLAGAIIHAPLIEAAGGFRITAVATSRPETLASRRDAPRADSDPLGVAQADDVDLVVVASPNASHFVLARAALDAGKAVVIDKPFVLSVADADALIALAEQRGVLLTVFHNRRWDGDFIAVRDALQSGRLGEILLFEARWDRFRPRAAPSWRNSDEVGAGVLWDLGPHLIDQMLQLFGSPDAIMADIASQRPDAVADDYFELTFRYGRMRCVLSASSVVAAARPRFAVHGVEGSFMTYGIDPFEDALRAGKHPSDGDFLRTLPSICCAWRIGEQGQSNAEVRAGSWVAFYADVAAAMRGERAAPVDPDEAREVIAIIERAYAERV
jgi:scyllo-inositol 2-dehydrogenase (NADP+)